MELYATVISDTHNKHKDIVFPELKSGDNIKNILIHCGDFSHSPEQVFSFCKWFSEVPGYDERILIAGNHDKYIEEVGYKSFKEYCEEKDIIYLQDTSVIIDGIKFHGSPWSNEFGNWSFMKDDFELDQYWQKIPDDVDVLITHGPAYGVGDEVQQDISNPHVGSNTLKYHINNRLKNLRFHFFGHIHEDYGIHQQDNYIVYNASIFNWYKKEINKPYIFEIKEKNEE